MYLYMNAKCFKTIKYFLNANCDHVSETMGRMVSEWEKMRHGQQFCPGSVSTPPTSRE